MEAHNPYPIKSVEKKFDYVSWQNINTTIGDLVIQSRELNLKSDSYRILNNPAIAKLKKAYQMIQNINSINSVLGLKPLTGALVNTIKIANTAIDTTVNISKMISTFDVRAKEIMNAAIKLGDFAAKINGFKAATGYELSKITINMKVDNFSSLRSVESATAVLIKENSYIILHLD